jgi:hypothetical protein
LAYLHWQPEVIGSSCCCFTLDCGVRSYGTNRRQEREGASACCHQDGRFSEHSHRAIRGPRGYRVLGGWYSARGRRLAVDAVTHYVVFHIVTSWQDMLRVNL